MSKKLKKNEEYPLPEGCMAIQIRNANIDYDTNVEYITYENSFVKKSIVDDYCTHYGYRTLKLEARTMEDILFLTGKPSERFPSLNGKDILIIITDSEEE